MGVIEAIVSLLFGGQRNLIKETVEVFRENAEAASERDARYRGAALNQFAAEFAVERKGRFDRFMDALNRVPRPAMALGTLGLFVAAMVDPIWFAARMQGIALVPEPLWWLLGAIVSFYFGARHQVKSQEFQRSIAATVLRAADVSGNIASLRALAEGAGEPVHEENAALADWRAQNDG